MKRSIFFIFIFLFYVGGTGQPMKEQSNCSGALASCEGKTVRRTGKIAPIPWQHPVKPRKPYININYFDITAGEKNVVIYSLGPITCPGLMTITGKVEKIEAGPKRPKGGDQKFTEYQIYVDQWECQK